RERRLDRTHRELVAQRDAGLWPRFRHHHLRRLVFRCRLALGCHAGRCCGRTRAPHRPWRGTARSAGLGRGRGSEGARGGEIAGALVCRGLLPLQYPRPKVRPGSQREHYGGRPGERQSYTPPQADRGLPVTRAERRSRVVWGGGEPEQLICARDECPLFLQAAAAAGALCDMCLDVLGLERRELAVEVSVPRAARRRAPCLPPRRTASRARLRACGRAPARTPPGRGPPHAPRPTPYGTGTAPGRGTCYGTRRPGRRASNSTQNAELGTRNKA